MDDENHCNKCGGRTHHTHMHRDKYGLGMVVENIAFFGFCVFFILFCGQCTGCVDVLSKF